ncbi:hypothetical protein FCM66_00815 [Mycoplasma bovis]|nr:hypothetical protein [Mycoplasmopsis bovis]
MKTSPQWFKTLVKSITANDQVLGEMLAKANKENNSVSFSYKVAPKEININFKGLSQPEVLPLFLKDFPEYKNQEEQAKKIIASSSYFARFYSSTRIINIWNYDLGYYFEVIDNYGKNKPLITLCFKDNLNNGILPKLLKVERLKAGSLVAITNNNEIICFNDLLTLRENNLPGVNITFKAQIPTNTQQTGKMVFSLSESQVNNDLIDLAIWDSKSTHIWYGQIDISPKNGSKQWNYAQEIKVTNERVNDWGELVRSESKIFEVTNVKNMQLTTSEKVINNKREFFGNMLVNVGPESENRELIQQEFSVNKLFAKKKYSDFSYFDRGIVTHNQILEFKVDHNKVKQEYTWDFWSLGVQKQWTTIFKANISEWLKSIKIPNAGELSTEWTGASDFIFHHDIYIAAGDGNDYRKFDKHLNQYLQNNKHRGKSNEELEAEFLSQNHLVVARRGGAHRGDKYLYEPSYLRSKLSFKIPDATFYFNKMLNGGIPWVISEARYKDANTLEFRIAIAGEWIPKTIEFEIPGKEIDLGMHPDFNFIGAGFLELDMKGIISGGKFTQSQLIHLHFIKGGSKNGLIFAKDTGIDDVHSTGQGIIINNNEILVPVLKNEDSSTNSWKIYQFKNNLEISDKGLLNKQRARLYARLPQALVKSPKLYAITENANDKPWVFVVDDNFISSYVGQNNSEVLPNTNAQFELFQIYDSESNAYKLDLRNQSELMIFKEQNNARILGNFIDERSKKSFKKWINLRYDGKPYHKDNFPYVYAWNYNRDILQNNFKAAYCADEDGEFYLPIKDTIVKNNEVKFISILKNTTLNIPTGKLNAHKVQIIDNNGQVIVEKKQNFHHKTPFDNYQITFAKTFNVFMFENKVVNERYANLIASLWKDISSFDKLRLTHFRVKVKLPKYDTSEGIKRFVGTYEVTKEFEIHPDNVLVEGNSAFMYFPFVMETDPNADTVISDLEIGNRNTGEYNKVAAFDEVVIEKDENVTHKYTYEIVEMKFLEYLD